jgi:hypothetical protein
VRFRPAQVHAQEHLRPVLGLGTARARLDVEVGAVGVHLAREHASELEAGQPLLERSEVRLDLADGLGILFLDSEAQQFVGVAETGSQFVEDDDDLLELRALLAQGLRPLGFVPDIRLFQLALDFYEPLGFAVVVKDTPSTQPCVQRGR